MHFYHNMGPLIFFRLLNTYEGYYSSGSESNTSGGFWHLKQQKKIKEDQRAYPRPTATPPDTSNPANTPIIASLLNPKALDLIFMHPRPFFCLCSELLSGKKPCMEFRVGQTHNEDDRVIPFPWFWATVLWFLAPETLNPNPKPLCLGLQWNSKTLCMGSREKSTPEHEYQFNV